MAQPQPQQAPPIFGFNTIQLLKDQRLGVGSYGSVCKAVCDELICAAKIIHQELIGHEQVLQQTEHRLPISRFMQECEFMSAIKHPNIVQFLGTSRDPQTDLPVLLMELMDDSLTHFLESSLDAVPYHIQVNFSHDISLAISYLHSNGITHRDLSSNNVLLCGNVKAKVTDFGMARVLGDRRASINFLTLCPGTVAYMPPEARRENPTYTEKIDCFAIGALIVQILTKLFPQPEDGLQAANGCHYLNDLEIGRRQYHIGLVDPNHPLLPIALDCLKDHDVARPSAQELCHRTAALKEGAQFTESVRRAEERPQPDGNETGREEEMSELQKQIEDKDIQNCQMQEEHARQIQDLQLINGSQNETIEQKDDIIRNKQTVIENGQQECQRLRDTIEENDKLFIQQLESSQQTITQLQEKIQELETELGSKVSLEDSITELQRSLSSLTRKESLKKEDITLVWREARKAPRKIYRRLNTAADGGRVYFTVHDSRNILVYNSENETWDQLPECLVEECSIAIVNDHLTTVGGKSSAGKVTNQLFSLTMTGIDRSKKWKEMLQPMPTKRSSPVVVCSGQALVVAGGVGQDKKGLTKVEIMDTATQKWSTATDLPSATHNNGCATICGQRIYLIGGYDNLVQSAYTCTLASLLLSCRSRSFRERIAQATQPRSLVWEKIADLPVAKSTCVTFCDQVLAIGGSNSKFMPTANIYKYNATFDKWEVISKMRVSRRVCYAAVLPDNRLMVMGGRTTSSFTSETDSVEIANLM